MDFGGPTKDSEGGEIIPIKKIIKTYSTICSAPKEVECRAKLYPGLPLSQLGQVVKCNAKDGLVCLNKHQTITQQCLNFEIRVSCCDGKCGSTTTQSPTATSTWLSNTKTIPTKTSASMTPKSTVLTPTPGCLCHWSDWIDFGGPTTGSEGGEIIPLKGIIDSYLTVYTEPKEVECRAKLYPELSLSQLGQVVKCSTKDGLVCLNKNQSITQQCFDYIIRVFCCHGKCGGSTQAPATFSMTPNIITLTPTPACNCHWSEWMDFGGPTTGLKGGEIIPIKTIIDSNPTTCSTPKKVECRSKLYPELHISELGQVVKCNLQDGLVCLNKNQDITQQCFDYEMRLLCCHGQCISTSLPSSPTLSVHSPPTSTSTRTTTTSTITAMTSTISLTANASTTPKENKFPSECICQWSDWIDFGSPTTGPKGGEIIPIMELIHKNPNSCSAPFEVECRAKLYPGLLLSQLGQVVTCNPEDGLVCLNKNQEVTQQCFDYEIKIICCQGLCGKTSRSAVNSRLIQYLSSNTIITKTTSLPIKGHITAHQECACEIYGDKYEPGAAIYNKTDGDGWCYIAKCVKTEEKCDVIKLSVPCLTTASPSASTALTSNCDKYITPLTNGESINEGNCYTDTCINGTIKHEAVQCVPVEYPVCENKYPPLKVTDKSGCCFKYECQCICNGLGGTHYITFDGIHYPFQGNCSYVLVKEIDPKYNLSVIIDSALCDSDNGLSCPKSLRVYYKSLEIFMSQKVSGGAVTNLIHLNHKTVNLPFQNKDIRAIQNGIESFLFIPEIGAQITFTGKQFSINLPWHKFHGNTEGQCGTCDNNQRDDCRLPDSTIVSSCQDMAPYWHAHKNNSFCTPSRPVPTSKPCPRPAICKIIESKIFEKCHQFAPYEPYIAACNSDVCHMKCESIGCGSLQAYAEQCAMAGVCVEWRNATNGVCDFECNKPLEYKACGPQVEPTCDARFNLKYGHEHKAFSHLESTGWEGCYCPSGTTLLRPNSKICIPSCEICTLPNGRWKKANETWTMGCDVCTCEEESLTIHCEPLPCPKQDPVICDQDGQIRISETVGCCQRMKCGCNTSLCPSKSFTCPVGHNIEMKMGLCCPVYRCVPKHVCVFNDTEYKAGNPVPISKCKHCLCSANRDHRSQQHSIECQPVQCDTHCQRGYEYRTVPGWCCGKCVQTSCVVVYAGNISHTIPDGEIWSPPGDKCSKFKCVKIGMNFIATEFKIDCPKFNPAACVPGTEVIAPNGCCKRCIYLPKQCNISKISTYLESNGCRTAKPVEMSICGGSCGTYSMYSMKDKAIQHSSSCCREVATKERKVQLICPNGSKVIEKYIHIEKCGCLETERQKP
ncbi:mucin-5AC [Xyrauchen texanus]|uniref:mucin-5AC n=1 Tax=Xyrauchen texanus TaxID=154827 RepID=UPI00224200C7|nr:mucin-5AC [Xyrauchen texanus]